MTAQGAKGSASNFTWKQIVVPVAQFVIPTEVRGVLDGWEKKRKQQEELKRTQPTIELCEVDENRTEAQTKTESRGESAQVRKKPSCTVPPLPIGGRRKATQMGKKTQELPQLVRGRSKEGGFSWQTEPLLDPKAVDEVCVPALPPKPPSRGRKSEIASHLSLSISEYNEMRHRGDTHTEALNKTSSHARDILRDPRRQKADFELFSTEQVLSSATMSRERELEDKLSALFNSISSGAKAQFKIKSELTATRNRALPQARSRSWKREPAI